MFVNAICISYGLNLLRDTGHLRHLLLSKMDFLCLLVSIIVIAKVLYKLFSLMVIIMFFIQAELSVIPFDLRCKACQQPVSRPCLIDWPGTGCESCRAKGELCDLEDSESESVSSSKSVSDANVIPPCSYLMSIAVMILIISLRLFSCCCSLVFVLSSHTIS